MNTDPRDEPAMREWALQERALDAERRGEPAGADTRIDRYRAIARALREPVEPQLPPDFARRVARRVRDDAAASGSAELRIATAMVAVLGAVALGWLVRDGGAAFASLPVATNAWVLALGACVGTSALVQWWSGARLRRR